MKVKVIKSGLKTYWYVDRIGEVFEVEQPNISDFDYKVINDTELYRHYINEEDCEIMKEVQSNTPAFDMKKEAWFIRTPTPEISKLVQEWLFEQGFEWAGKDTSYLADVYENYQQLAAIGHINVGIQLGYAPLRWYTNVKEIKLSFKITIDSVEYPVVETSQQRQIRELEETIAKASEQIKALRGDM